jgi:DNA-binding FadR family transcriptional regulator
MTPEETKKAQKVLDSIETFVTGETPIDYDAVMEADIEFHRIIAHASGNPALEALIDALGNRTIRSRTWHAISDRGAVPSAQRDHRGILEALRQREPEHARLRMAVHLLNVEEFIYAHPTDVLSEG